MNNPIYLSSDDIRSLADPSEYVEAVREGFRERGNGAPANPRERLHSSDPKGLLTGYNAILPDMEAMGGYLYSAGFDEGDAWFICPLFDAEKGELIALLDGSFFNPFKTGATGAVAVDALARNDASVMAVIGSGPQARGQLTCTAEVRDLEEVRVFSPTQDHREAFAEEMTEVTDTPVEAVDTSQKAVQNADIVVTATTSSSPVFEGLHLKEGSHVTAMGQYHPDKNELDATTIQRSKYVIDLHERLMEDAGSFINAVEEEQISPTHLHAELGEVIVGQKQGRTDQEDVTVFDSGGTAIETVAAANMLYNKAREQEVGTELDLAPASEALTGRMESRT